MLGTDFTKNKKAQSGSVMLEVIAVLALMGVMGAMLFRQIYQRNQELHNIQMASEIRTVKEAFSAYIQAYRTELFSACNSGPLCSKDSAEIGKAISQFLPAGWFADSRVENYYTFTMWSYTQDEVTNKKIIYGLIAPKETTLPQTGWNFKRAARVALLIGADGGVYGDGITSGQIAGALGTWHLDEHSDMGLEPTTYVAMTGLDVFTPEYNLPEGNVNLRENWHLATEELGAWNYFSVGGGKTSCFVVGHDEQSTDAGLMRVNNDGITRPGTTCQPLFYVDNEKSKVFVNNDLEIGQGTTANVTITQEGVIKQENGLTIDKDGRIISGNKVGKNVGDLTTNDRYVVDPAYTSTMNDIRLASRGGVRLSDILPNYILKATQELGCDITSGDDNCTSTDAVTDISCPTGYIKAYLITPIQFATQSAPTSAKVSVSTSETAVTGVTLTGTPVSGVNLTKGPVTSESVDSFVKLINPNNFKISFDNANRKITFEYSKQLNTAQTMKARVDSYCVAPDLSGVPDKDNEAGCKAAGFTWNATKGCVYQYVSCATIGIGNNGGTNIDNKPAVCKAAGCQWNGSTCA